MADKKLTDEKWLNLFVRNVGGVVWSFASRADQPVSSIAEKQPDAVIIAAVVDNPGEPLRHVCTVERRIPLGGSEFGFPAGLIDEGETVETAAERELFEETGLAFNANSKSPLHLVSSAGMSDETVQIVFGTASGTITNANQEANEEINTHLLTRDQLAELCKQDNPLNCVGWSAKAWPILLAFSAGGLDELYGIKSL